MGTGGINVYVYSYVQHIICIYKITGYNLQAWGSVRIPRFLSREKSCHPLLNGKGSKSTIPTTKRRCAQAALLNDWCALAKLVELQQRKKNKPRVFRGKDLFGKIFLK